MFMKLSFVFKNQIRAQFFIQKLQVINKQTKFKNEEFLRCKIENKQYGFIERDIYL